MNGSDYRDTYSDSDHSTTQTGVESSGIAFKNTDAVLCLTQKYSKGCSGWVEINQINGGSSLVGNMFLSATDEGYNITDIVNNVVNGSSVFRFGFNPADYSASGKMAAIHFVFPAGSVLKYRNFLRGAIVYSDW